MNRKNKIIIGLVAIATILFCIIQFYIVPASQQKQADYAKNQTDALAHDITSIEDFKSAYIGDASNTGNLLYALPLNNISMKFQINSEERSLTVNYLDTVWNVGENKTHRDLIYNTVALMASIDNLTTVTYNFSGDSFSFARTKIEAVFGPLLADLLDKEVWSEKIQNKINSADFINQFFAMDNKAK